MNKIIVARLESFEEGNLVSSKVLGYFPNTISSLIKIVNMTDGLYSIQSRFFLSSDEGLLRIEIKNIVYSKFSILYIEEVPFDQCYKMYDKSADAFYPRDIFF